MNKTPLPDNKNEDYTLLEKFIIIVFWFDIFTMMSNADLKKNGYATKHKSRMQCMIIGVVLYSVILLKVIF